MYDCTTLNLTTLQPYAALAGQPTLTLLGLLDAAERTLALGAGFWDTVVLGPEQLEGQLLVEVLRCGILVSRATAAPERGALKRREVE